MSKFRAALLGAVLGATVLLAPPAAALADDGNGNSTCDYTEICLRWSSASDFSYNGNYMHTYYHSSWNHYKEYLYGQYGSFFVQDSVKGVWNRDSSCRVQLWDFTSYSGWYVYADLPIGYRGDAGYHQNNAHERCYG